MDELSRLYGALADPTRRAIVERLVGGEATVAELRRPLAMTAPAVSKHLQVLEGAGVIERQRRGRHMVCRLKPRGLDGAAVWLEQQRRFWTGTLRSLAEHVELVEREQP